MSCRWCCTADTMLPSAPVTDSPLVGWLLNPGSQNRVTGSLRAPLFLASYARVSLPRPRALLFLACYIFSMRVSLSLARPAVSRVLYIFHAPDYLVNSQSDWLRKVFFLFSIALGALACIASISVGFCVFFAIWARGDWDESEKTEEGGGSRPNIRTAKKRKGTKSHWLVKRLFCRLWGACKERCQKHKPPT